MQFDCVDSGINVFRVPPCRSKIMDSFRVIIGGGIGFRIFSFLKPVSWDFLGNGLFCVYFCSLL